MILNSLTCKLKREARNGFRTFHAARPTIYGFEAMLWLHRGIGFDGAFTLSGAEAAARLQLPIARREQE